MVKCNKLLCARLDENRLLFFPFSSSDVGEPIPCADGKEYEIDEDSDFGLGAADFVGYLVQVKNRVVTINSAIESGGMCPAPEESVDILRDCDVFEKPMIDFLKKFMKK